MCKEEQEIRITQGISNRNLKIRNWKDNTNEIGTNHKLRRMNEQRRTEFEEDYFWIFSGKRKRNRHRLGIRNEYENK